ncbi:MAG: hypothetical protein ACYTFY_07980 [Planctomycetota bacterium]
MKNSNEKPPENIKPDSAQYDKNGVDLTQIRKMLSMTPIERLRYMQKAAGSILRMKNGIKPS